MRRRVVAIALLAGMAGAMPASAAFAANANMTGAWCQGPNPPPTCRTPEAPLPVGLPLAGLVVAGGYLFVLRRKQGLPEGNA